MNPVSAFEQLMRWSRKHYRWSIVCGGSVQPGDGVTVILEAAGRKVTVDDYECDIESEDGTTDHWGDADDAILEALRRWRADEKPKRFRIIWSAPESPPDGFDWSSWCNGDRWYVELIAPTESKAIAILNQFYREADRDEPKDVSIWELGYAA
jgi:hypothetical protein